MEEASVRNRTSLTERHGDLAKALHLLRSHELVCDRTACVKTVGRSVGNPGVNIESKSPRLQCRRRVCLT